jgi:F-type H+-transporting ATPase subunit a
MSSEAVNEGFILSNLVPQVPASVSMAALAWAIVGGVSLAVALKPKLVPSGLQIVMEGLFGYICGLADDIVGPKASRFYPLFIGLFFFILVSNLMGLVPALKSPTSDPALTFGLAIMIFIYFNAVGIMDQGWGYFRQFAGPKMPLALLPVKVLIIVVEIISLFLRPFSLGLRLFCNIFSKEMFLAVLTVLIYQFFILEPSPINIFVGAVSTGLRLVVPFLGLIVAFIQALVFTVLSMTYIAGAVQAQEH